MFREKVKKMLPIMQAVADGKNVQVAVRDGIWIPVNNFTFFGSPEDYRIKPATTYRPYNREECEALVGRSVRGKQTGMAKLICAYDPRINEFDVNGFRATPYDLKCEYEWIDGSPCGVKEGSDAEI